MCDFEELTEASRVHDGSLVSTPVDARRAAPTRRTPAEPAPTSPPRRPAPPPPPPTRVVAEAHARLDRRDVRAERQVLGQTPAPRPQATPTHAPSPTNPSVPTHPSACPVPTAGERAAQAAVDVDGGAIGDERARLEGDVSRAGDATRAQVDALFHASGARTQPRGVTVTADGDRVERVTRDTRGNVVRREVGERDGDTVRYTRTDLRDGHATRQSYVAEGDRTTVSTTDWREPASANPSEPTWDTLAARAQAGDPSVALHEVSYHRTDDALETRERAVTHEGENQIDRRYSRQTNGDGIHGALEGALDLDDGVDVVTSTERARPYVDASGARALGDESVTQGWSYGQGDVRVSAFEVEGDDVPKQWQLEKQEGATYRAQTFVEGSEDFTTITERTARGAQVDETVRARGLDADGEEYDLTSTSHTTYAADGSVAAQRLDRRSPDGARFELDYARTVAADGTSRATSRATHTAPDGAVTSVDRQVDGVVDANGERVTRVASTVRGAAGEATSTYDARGGQQLTVNGRPVPLAEDSPELAALSEGERELATQATTDVLANVKKAADQGKNVYDLVKVAGAGMTPGAAGTTVVDQFNRRIEQNRLRLELRFGDARVAATEEALLRGASGAKAGVGALGVLASSFSLVSDLERRDWVRAGLDVGGIAVGGANVAVGARELAALRATPNGALALDDLGSFAGKFGAFAKFGGLALGVGVGGYQVVDGIARGDGVSIAQGGVGVAGTIGAFAAGGAIGGPAGVLVGIGIGGLTLGAQWAIGKLWGSDEPKLADVEI